MCVTPHSSTRARNIRSGRVRDSPSSGIRRVPPYTSHLRPTPHENTSTLIVFRSNTFQTPAYNKLLTASSPKRALWIPLDLGRCGWTDTSRCDSAVAVARHQIERLNGFLQDKALPSGPRNVVPCELLALHQVPCDLRNMSWTLYSGRLLLESTGQCICERCLASWTSSNLTHKTHFLRL